MNAVELIKKHHREVEALFEQFERSKRREEKQVLFMEIAARLVGHDAIEREIFYPACERALGKNDEKLMEGIAEHGSMEFALFRADKAKGKETFDYMVKVLKEIVEHHVEEEESEILPKASRRLGAEQLERLGSMMLERYEESLRKDFRPPLRRNLEQVLGGRARTTPPPKRAARAGTKRRAVKAGARGRAATARSGSKKRTVARAKRRASA